MSDSYYAQDEPGINVTTILGVIFFPITIVGFIFHYVFQRKLKYPIIDILIITILVSVLSGIVGFYFIGLSDYINVLGSVFTVPKWGSIIGFSVFYILFFGSITGFIFCLIQDYKMKHNPELVETSGDWMYKFKYNQSFMRKRLHKKDVTKIRSGEYTNNEETCVGTNKDTLDPVFRHIREAATHTLVLGTVGSGKTVTMTNLIYGDIKAGRSVVVMDFKGDAGFSAKLAFLAKTYGRSFYHFTAGTKYNIPYSNGFSTYDPLAGGGPTSKIERIMSLRKWTDDSDVYKNAYNSVVDPVVKAHYYIINNRDIFTDSLLKQYDVTLDFTKPLLFFIEDLFVQKKFLELATVMGIQINGPTETIQDIENKQRVFSQLSDIVTALDSKRPNNISSAVDQIAAKVRTILNSEYGIWLSPNKGYDHIDLLKLLSVDGNVVLFSFSVEDSPDFAEFMGSLVFADIATVFSNRMNSNVSNRVSIYADEFQSVNPIVVQGLLQKARAANMPITLGLQSLNSLADKYSGNVDRLISSMKEVVGNFIVHNGMDAETAVSFSKDIGEHLVHKYTVRRRSNKSFLSFNWFNKRENSVNEGSAREYIFPPDNFAELESPSPQNDYTPTAVFLKKNDMYNKRSGISPTIVKCYVPDIVLQSHNLLQGEDVKIAFYETTQEYKTKQKNTTNTGKYNPKTGEFTTENAFNSGDEDFGFDNYDLSRYSVNLGDGDNVFVDDDNSQIGDNDFSITDGYQQIIENNGVTTVVSNNDNSVVGTESSLPDLNSVTIEVGDILLEQTPNKPDVRVSKNYFNK